MNTSEINARHVDLVPARAARVRRAVHLSFPAEYVLREPLMSAVVFHGVGDTRLDDVANPT